MVYRMVEGVGGPLLESVFEVGAVGHFVVVMVDAVAAAAPKAV